MFVDIEGQIERITYCNEEDGYTIAKMKIRGKRDVVTIVGNLYSISPGEILKVKGYWVNHEKYGEQLKVVSYESVVPATVEGIERYLGSGMIKGIGPVTAKRLVSKFGKDTLNIIEKHIERLYEVEGVGEKRIETIKKAWEEQKEIREVMVFLQGYGISPAFAVKIFKCYGKDSVKVVKENPFKLAEDVSGIGFVTADKIAEKLGIPKDSPMRAEAGILYVLRSIADDGHVFYPMDSLIEKCEKILKIQKEIIISSLRRLELEKKIVIEKAERENGEAVYLTEFHICENGIAKNLRALLSRPKPFQFGDSKEIIDWVQKEMKISLAQNQIEAIRKSIDEKVLVITGGPGTGKTTIVKAIMNIYKRLNRKILFCAPTGKAAKRMTEVTGHEAKTIHRLLEYSPALKRFKKDENNLLHVDLLVIDEVSMVDTILMYHLLKAVPKEATLILVGDMDQLPSVGPGNILKDIIESCCVPTVKLNEIFRQARESLIVVNAHRINEGKMPFFSEKGGTDFFFISMEEPEKVLEWIIDLCSRRIPQRFGYDPFDEIQVMSPMNKGLIGVTNLNKELQKALNNSSDEIVRGGRLLKVGDKVMQIVNNYEKDVYNGDIGRIRAIDREFQEVLVEYEGKVVSYDYSELDEIMLSYAISVHKSQGSEYPVIVMPITIQHYVLLQRNLLYTAITRAKKMVVLIGSKRAVAIAIKNNKPEKRYTLLKERLLKTLGEEKDISF